MEKQNILIIDDEPAITQSLRRSLRDNFEVFTANTVTQAMEILQQREIAVIITDQRMPDMQGVDFLKSAHMVQPNSLSLLLSGYSDIQALVAALNVSTVRGFIPKPWDNQELLQKIDDTVKEYRAVIKNPQMLKESTAAVAELQTQVEDLKHLIDTITMGSDPQKPSTDAANKQQAEMDSENRSIESIYATSTGVSARLLGLLHLREANPAKFEELKERYIACLEQAFDQKVYKIKYPISISLQNIADELGLLRAGPRDIIEIHNFAIRALFEKYNLPRRQVYLEEGRLLLLEMMGDLVKYYRINFFRQIRDE